MSCNALVACELPDEKSAESFLEIPLHVTHCFPLAPFKSVSLASIFVILTTICLDMGLFGFILFGTLCFLHLDFSFRSQVREVFSHYLSK